MTNTSAPPWESKRTATAFVLPHHILLDENIDGYAEYLSGHLFSAAWNDVSTSLGVRIVTFETVGLVRGATDEQIWLLCQEQRFFLLTDNRNDDDDGSLQSIILGANG